MVRPTCGLPSDLPSDGHEVNATASAESNRIRWSSHRKICSLAVLPDQYLLSGDIQRGKRRCSITTAPAGKLPNMTSFESGICTPARPATPL